jgi:hypothetical protein
MNLTRQADTEVNRSTNEWMQDDVAIRLHLPHLRNRDLFGAVHGVHGPTVRQAPLPLPEVGVEDLIEILQPSLQAAGSLRTSTRIEIGSLHIFWDYAHTHAWTRFVHATSVECLFSITPLPSARSPSPGTTRAARVRRR